MQKFGKFRETIFILATKFGGKWVKKEEKIEERERRRGGEKIWNFTSFLAAKNQNPLPGEKSFIKNVQPFLRFPV